MCIRLPPESITVVFRLELEPFLNYRWLRWHASRLVEINENINLGIVRTRVILIVSGLGFALGQSYFI